MTTETNIRKQPDQIVYYSEDLGKGITRRIKVGAVWNHSKGDGFYLRLDALPVRGFNGELVAFPPNAEADQDSATDETSYS